jgi:hypothetical protein
MLVKPLDRDALRKRFRAAEPFPFVVIEDFLDPDFALEVARSYPKYEDAVQLGHTFKGVNENRKVQVCDYTCFPNPVKKLADALAAPEFRETLSDISGIRDLLWDDTYAGGGMHQTGSHGLLDVHVDFNRLPSTGNFRRLNLLLYLNPTWSSDWGGALELWDRDVQKCHHTIEPALNRCVIFETSERSFHGVTRLTCPPDVSRISFALYFYTREGAPGLAGKAHNTIFKARPEEYLKKHVLMPAVELEHQIGRALRAGKDAVKRLVGRK